MNEDKFQEKTEVSYEKLFRIRFGGMVILAKELERELGRERMLEIVGDACDRQAVENIKEQIEGKPMETIDDFAALLDEMADSPYYEHTTTMTRRRDGNRIIFDVRECLWAKTFEEMGDKELGYAICCQGDYAMAPAVSPKLSLKRTKTLMQGDECCDHMWCWED